MITGEGSLEYHLVKMNIKDDDNCSLCLDEADTAAHIVSEYPALASKKLRIIGRILLNVNSNETQDLNKC